MIFVQSRHSLADHDISYRNVTLASQSWYSWDFCEQTKQQTSVCEKAGFQWSQNFMMDFVLKHVSSTVTCSVWRWPSFCTVRKLCDGFCCAFQALICRALRRHRRVWRHVGRWGSVDVICAQNIVMSDHAVRWVHLSFNSTVHTAMKLKRHNNTMWLTT